MDTIAAISTPIAQGGISVIRISGAEALAVAQSVFHGRSPSEMDGYTCAYGRVFDADGDFDDCVLTVFREPHSYTGEDIVELSCHGGVYVTKHLLNCIIAAGARPAKPGEFTRRAFLNGKLDLTAVEGVADIIGATSEAELNSGSALRFGLLFERVRSIREDILSVLSSLEAWVDFPEEDLPETAPATLLSQLCAVRDRLNELLSGYDDGCRLRKGIDCVLVGKPNVGKSTLMNLLAGYSRSIVSDIPGTTRDFVDASVSIGSLTLNISDTAGIRDSDDVIEKLGVELSLQRLAEAQLVLAVFDSSEEFSDDDQRILSSLSPANTIIIINKTDIESRLSRQPFSAFNTLELSAVSDSSADILRSAICAACFDGNTKPDSSLIVNIRQKSCADTALLSVCDAISALENGETLDVLSVLLEEAVAALLSLTGEKASDAIVDEIFSHFCVGK